jgi:hypothetical protein
MISKILAYSEVRPTSCSSYYYTPICLNKDEYLTSQTTHLNILILVFNTAKPRKVVVVICMETNK